MAIDWFTVVAQVVNFLVLVWLLKRFLYKPILHAINEREKRINTQLEESEARKVEAQKERDDFRSKNEEFEQCRKGLLTKAVEEAQTERQSLLDDARNEFETLRAKLNQNLLVHKNLMISELTSRTQAEVLLIAREILANLADTNLEERVSEVFIERLQALDGGEKSRLASFIKETENPVIVRSAFELSPTRQASIERAINEIFSADAQLQFEVTPELISGIELTVGGYKIAWSIADYLTSLEKRVSETMAENHETITAGT